MAKEKRSNTAVNEHGASMDKIVSLCKRRGFVYPSSEIYGGLSATWDYGPLGVELKKNIQEAWWKEMVRRHDNIVGLDAAIMMHPRTWEASGHVENFSDPLVDCKKCKTRFRADHLEEIRAERNISHPNCPECGGELTEPRQFNLMFTTHMGPVADSGSVIYLRPETAQGIFVNFKNVVDTSRVQIPFGIAQVGKAFRNEITTKNFIFRTCEFEQMEMQYFVKPGTEDELFDEWKAKRMAWYRERLGILPERLRFSEHGPDELAHYAKVAFDIQYLYPFGWQELEGIHSRTDYDLGRHGEYCGKEITYLDPDDNSRYVPYVIETSSGLTRSVLVSLIDAYHEEAVEDETRTVLHFHPDIAPVKVGVFPLVKKDGLAELAQKVELELREDFFTFYDQGGAIGRRYRRMDEIGTPFCVTIDYETKDKHSVTLRFRDSMAQVRVPLAGLSDRIRQEIRAYSRA
ncbi:MAG: glycine--tRNA ligase [Spirochaeta sp. LUC14_002_19_P3]|nr:MAG: glycine--tRNA ligase [Spirochaeta sp. LUC14_002_19_P3]